MNKNNKSTGIFILRVCSAHVIAYFIAGALALAYMNYKVHFSSESMALLMKPVESPWVIIGPALQVIRGLIIALVLLPVRSFIFEKNGFLKLMWLILGLSFISTIGPTPGSFDGYIFTILPIQYHLMGIPEALLYTFLFSGIISRSYKSEKKYIDIITVILVIIIVCLSVLATIGTINSQRMI